MRNRGRETLLTVRSIVFSFWKSTLDLASSALRQAGFNCLQVDGDVPANRRKDILHRFSKLETEVVLLMSLSCGAVGYVLDTMVHAMGGRADMCSNQAQSHGGKSRVFNGATMESGHRRTGSG